MATDDADQRSHSLLAVREACKKYSSGFTLGPLSFDLQEGETIAFLGKNGAGKSTLFQGLTGNSDLTSGEIRVGGDKLIPDRYKLKRKIGYLPQKMVLPRWATGAELLNYCARLYGLGDAKTKVESSMQYWDCYSYRDLPLAACSHGMQKRVGLAIATLHDPAILILDEPFSGLDIYHIRALENLIKDRQASGGATILSTHIAPYVAKLCDRVHVLQEGQMQTLSPWTELTEDRKVENIDSQFFS